MVSKIDRPGVRARPMLVKSSARADPRSCRSSSSRTRDLLDLDLFLANGVANGLDAVRGFLVQTDLLDDARRLAHDRFLAARGHLDRLIAELVRCHGTTVGDRPAFQHDLLIVQRDILFNGSLDDEAANARAAMVNDPLAHCEALLGELDGLTRPGRSIGGRHRSRRYERLTRCRGGLGQPISCRPLIDIDRMVLLEDLHDACHVGFGRLDGDDGRAGSDATIVDRRVVVRLAAEQARPEALLPYGRGARRHGAAYT